MQDNAVLVGLLPSDLALLAPLLHVMVLDQGSRRHQKLSLEHVYFPHQGMISLLGVTSRGETIEIASAGRDAALCPLVDPGAGEVIVIAQGAQSVSRVAIDRLQGVLRESETLRRALERCREDLLLQARQNLVCDGLHPRRAAAVPLAPGGGGSDADRRHSDHARTSGTTVGCSTNHRDPGGEKDSGDERNPLVAVAR
jgi:hypothetical protein